MLASCALIYLSADGIDLQAFLDFMCTYQEYRDEDREIVECFRFFDKDNSGALSRSDIKYAASFFPIQRETETLLFLSLSLALMTLKIGLYTSLVLATFQVLFSCVCLDFGTLLFSEKTIFIQDLVKLCAHLTGQNDKFS